MDELKELIRNNKKVIATTITTAIIALLTLLCGCTGKFTYKDCQGNSCDVDFSISKV